MLGQLFERMRGEEWAMAYTMADFERDYIKSHLPKLAAREQGGERGRAEKGREMILR